jgi:hypothetical protein
MKTIEEEDITIVMKIVRETKRKIKSPTWNIVTVTFRSLYHGKKNTNIPDHRQQLVFFFVLHY